jgi:hypothetical protein
VKKKQKPISASLLILIAVLSLLTGAFFGVNTATSALPSVAEVQETVEI